MFAKVKITMRIWKHKDLSKTATEIHGEMWREAADALRGAGFECQLEELVIDQSDVMEAMRRESK